MVAQDEDNSVLAASPSGDFSFGFQKVEKDGFYVQTGKGQIKVLALQIPGKKRMEADALLRGYQIEENTVLK